MTLGLKCWSKSIRIQENTDKKKLRIWTLFTLCELLEKKEMESCFSPTIDRYDGAKNCELIEFTYLPRKIINRSKDELYKDDGLLILHDVNGQQIDRTRKNIIKILTMLTGKKHTIK